MHTYHPPGQSLKATTDSVMLFSTTRTLPEDDRFVAHNMHEIEIVIGLTPLKAFTTDPTFLTADKFEHCGTMRVAYNSNWQQIADLANEGFTLIIFMFVIHDRDEALPCYIEKSDLPKVVEKFFLYK